MSVPSRAEVERTIKILEIPPLEAAKIRIYYAWARFRRSEWYLALRFMGAILLGVVLVSAFVVLWLAL